MLPDLYLQLDWRIKEGLESINTSQFLLRFTPDEETGEARDQVRPGDLFVVDEAGMSGTDELARISALVEQGGGKLLYTGDHHQLASVQSGGMLDLLAKDNGAYELESVRRFQADWEKQASIRPNSTGSQSYGHTRLITLPSLEPTSPPSHICWTPTLPELLRCSW